MNEMEIYNNFPIWLQNSACSFEGLRIKRTRYEKIFLESLAEYESNFNPKSCLDDTIKDCWVKLRQHAINFLFAANLRKRNTK